MEHDLSSDDSAKGRKIAEIHAAGVEPVITPLVERLTEWEALRIEAELISAFGTIQTGGIFTNAVSPRLDPQKRATRNASVPSGAVERAQIGLDLLLSAVLELARANDVGITNFYVVHSLGLRSDYKGGSKDYLSWSLL